MMKHKIQKWLCQGQEKNSQETATTLMAPIKPLTEATAQELIKQMEGQTRRMKSGLYPGFRTLTGFTLTREITTLDQFWRAINTEKSIFARHRMYPTAFFFSWNIKTIKEWIDAGRFYIATREEGKNKDQEEKQ